MPAAELRERLDTIETMLTYIMNSMICAGLMETVNKDPKAEGVNEILDTVEKLSDESAYVLGRYLDNYYENEEDEEDED